MIRVHRKEQYDLDCLPLVCAHWTTADESRRLFCLWRWGIQVGDWYWPRIKRRRPAAGALSMFTNGDEWVIGRDLADALASVQITGNADPEEWQRLRPEETATFLLDADGNLSDRGNAVEMTVADAITKFGRGFYATTEF